MDNQFSTDAVTLATELTIAWLGNPNTRTSAEDGTAFLLSMFEAVNGLTAKSSTAPEPVAATEYVPAVTVRKSLSSPDHLISLIDGKPYKTLRRHLSGHGLTPEEYRARYNLKADYPMVAPTYSEARRAMAKTIGLGRKPGQKMLAKGAPTTPAKRGRPSAAAKAAAQI
jgi:predicted transcriptional regulator